MTNWSFCYPFEDFEHEGVIEELGLDVKCGVYRFGYMYDGFIPKYIGKVAWTENHNSFMKRFRAYKYQAHNPEIRARIQRERKALWFQIMIVRDPDWTESRYLMDDSKTKDPAHRVYQWNDKTPKVAAERGRFDFRGAYRKIYEF